MTVSLVGGGILIILGAIVLIAIGASDSWMLGGIIGGGPLAIGVLLMVFGDRRLRAYEKRTPPVTPLHSSRRRRH